MYGYAGHIVKINLSSGKVRIEDTPASFINCIGGKIAAANFFYENVGNIDPLSPDNIIMFATGPANGSKILMASKLGVYFKSPLTNLFGESYMGGNLMADLKWAGVDALIIYGKSDNPVYIYMDGLNVEIRSAKHIWGLTTSESERVISEEVGDSQVSIVTIGPAGENLVKFACISHNSSLGRKRRGSKAGRLGGGAVLGSKRLKGIVVRRSDSKVEIYDSNLVLTTVKEVLRKVTSDPAGTGANNYRKYGTPGTLFPGLGLGFFPTHYYSRCASVNREKLNPDIIKDKFYRSNLACFNCILACGKYVSVDGTEGKGPEYETIFAFGGLNDIDNYKDIMRIGELCDELGIDTIEAGNVISLALYANEIGRISIGDYSFGNAEKIMELLRMISSRSGIGELLAEGVRTFSEIMNIGDLAIHVKGLSFPGYDPRVLKYMALEYCINNRGADHLRITAYAYEITGRLSRYKKIEDAVAFLVEMEDRNIISDSLILCRFSRFIYEWEDIINIIKGLTGKEYSINDLRAKANWARKLIRLFNIRQGLNPEKDDNLPRRIYDEPISFMDIEYRLSEDEVRKMVKLYYKYRGWNPDGIPT